MFLNGNVFVECGALEILFLILDVCPENFQGLRYCFHAISLLTQVKETSVLCCTASRVASLEKTWIALTNEEHYDLSNIYAIFIVRNLAQHGGPLGRGLLRCMCAPLISNLSRYVLKNKFVLAILGAMEALLSSSSEEEYFDLLYTQEAFDAVLGGWRAHIAASVDTASLAARVVYLMGHPLLSGQQQQQQQQQQQRFKDQGGSGACDLLLTNLTLHSKNQTLVRDSLRALSLFVPNELIATNKENILRCASMYKDDEDIQKLGFLLTAENICTPIPSSEDMPYCTIC